MKKNRTFGLTGLEYGHIFLPFPGNNIDVNSQEGVDYRSRIIKQCFRKQKVSVLFDNGGFANNCPISLQALRDVEFPEKFSNVGSPVLCYIEPLHRKPMIIGVFGKENDVDLSDEGDKKLSSIFKDSKAEVGVRGKRGEIFLNVDSSEETGGNVYINIKNTSNTGKLVLRVLGSSDIYTLGACTVTSNDNIAVKIRDVENDITSLFNVSKNGFTVTRDKSGLKKTLQDILNELIGLQTISPGGNGIVSPANITNLNSYLNDLENYLEG